MMPLTGFIGGITAGFLPGLCTSLLGVAAADPAAFRYPLILAGLLTALPLLAGVPAALAMPLLAARWRSLMSGAVMSASGLSMTLVSFGGGYLVAIIGYSGLFLGSAAITALGCSLFWFRFCATESERAPVLWPQVA